MNQLKLALRILARTPFVTSVAVLSLALGIGATAAIFSLFEQLLVRPLPVEEPDRLVGLSAPGPKPGSQAIGLAGGVDAVFSYAMFRDLEGAGGSFDGLAGHRSFDANLTTGGETTSGEGMLVSGSYFGVLGLQPARGRLIARGDDEAIGQHDVAVLSHRFWTTRLGADPGVLNERLVVNGRPLTVIGVAPPGFEGTTLGARPDVFVPVSMRAEVQASFDPGGFDDRTSYWLYAFGRLAPGVSRQQAAAELNAVYGRILDQVEAPLQQGMSPETLERFRAKELVLEDGRRGQSVIHAQVSMPLTLLLTITAVVLLIACANIANLLLARGAARSQEIAVRSSLGAGRPRLVGQLLVESALLAVLGGAGGLVIARWTLDLVGAILPPEAAATVRLELDPVVVAFAGVLALLTGILFGLYPALSTTRPALVSALKAAAGQPSGARAAARFRTTLVTTQIALSMALLIASGFFLKSLVNLSRVDLGIEEDHLVAFRVSPALNGYEPERTLALFERLEEELAALPGVSSVSGAAVPVLTGRSWASDIQVQGFDPGLDSDASSRLNRVGPGYFKTLGIPLIAGREFTAADGTGGAKVAIVNEAFAEKFGLGGRTAVGHRMATWDRDHLDLEIVGVVADAKYSTVKDEIPPQFFTPYRQDFDLGFLNLYLRTRVPPEQVMQPVRAAVKRLDPDLPVENLQAFDQQLRESLYLDRIITLLSAAFAVLATLLAAVGLYGVLAYSVAQRTREIGVRMALGAAAERVRWMILAQTARMVVVGGALGIAGALAAGRAARSLLYGVEGHDPTVVAIGATGLVVVAFAAGYLPAHRASGVDPMQALRNQ